MCLRTGVNGDGFYKAVSVVNQKATAMDYSKTIEYMSGEADYGPLWRDYAEKIAAGSINYLARLRSGVWRGLDFRCRYVEFN